MLLKTIVLICEFFILTNINGFLSLPSRSLERPKPKIFKVKDHHQDHLVVEEAMPEAIKNRAQLELPEGRARFLRHYNRHRLAMASQTEVLDQWDLITPKSEPNDGDFFANWLNTLSNKSMAIKDAIILDFHRPLVMHMMIIPNNFL